MRISADIGARIIEFEVKYRKRKTMAIQIDKTGAVSVFSPIGVSEDFIRHQVKSKAKWITKKLMDAARTAETIIQRRFQCGHKFMYLGQTYILNIAIEKTLKGVFVLEGVLYIRTSKKDEEHIKKLLMKWYRKQAEENLSERLVILGAKMGLKPRLVKVKEQKRRWGSCTFSGNIYLNWRIIMAPIEVIDYVIVHELAHLAHHDHSKNFWAVVERFMPDYRQRRQWLKNNAVMMDF